MLETTEAASNAATSVRDDVAAVCNRIPPLWDLHNYVAVNPFLGFTAQPIEQAARTVGDGLGAAVLPGVDFYRERWRAGAFGFEELAAAAERAGQDPLALKAVLVHGRPAPMRLAQPVLTFAERHDRAHGTDWSDTLVRSITRWCAVYASAGGTCWDLSFPDSLYGSWLEAARVDRSLEIAGLRGWRSWAARLPARPDEAIAAMLRRLEVPAAQRANYLYRLLSNVYGWASYLRRSSWEKGGEPSGLVADLLAIRICTDAAVAELAPRGVGPASRPAAYLVEDESVRLVMQEALEDGFARQLLGRLTSPPPSTPRSRPALQAVFCIDVRSEPLRRCLESQDAGIETYGFAGFFGVALDWQANGCASARCPVLLKPSVKLCPGEGSATDRLSARALKHIQAAPAASFSFVEVLGLAYGIRLGSDALAFAGRGDSNEARAAIRLEAENGGGVTLSARADLGAAILKNMGLRQPFAPIVLLCGHAARTANNPHAASLDCGACGGHGGALNARVAAALLNDPAVRDELVARSWNIPSDTHFLPALHNTTTDEVTLLDTEVVPAPLRRTVDEFGHWLARAGAGVRAERAPDLGLTARSPSVLDRLLRRRSADWSEVRPEWGLARNAAFLAARRVRTRGVDLQGRVFLHEYDATADADNSVLTLILTAPMVVASWINLQYFASTVDNHTFGCGAKTLHNRVGSIGVVLGNGGDLRTGLALQSVHNPEGRWFHEPLRLQVVVEAPRDRIDDVLARQQGVRDLVENGWVRLFALDSDSNDVYKREPGNRWQRFEVMR